MKLYQNLVKLINLANNPYHGYVEILIGSKC